ncbi:carboxylesterase family protein [Gammaproteobacteria bacterium]|nr:carboxylesterase family protein [Gammaproteobacteria bacterium]
MLVFTTSCSDQSVPEIHPETQRKLTTGPIVGFVNNRGAHEWRGLRFAAAPSGGQRWRPPQPPDTWVEAQSAVSSGNVCPQFDQSGDTVIGDEDCLFANVVAPPQILNTLNSTTDKLPAMVFIHGGGHVVGHAAEKDWSALALEHNIVVISLQFRLGPLGWFRYPALFSQGTSAEETSGNFTILDLIHGLRWVRDNAAHFGGDRNRVTIYGTSAGAGNVLSLLTSPLADDLYQSAIIQSAPEAPSATIAEAENPANASDPGHPASSSEVLIKLLSADSGLSRLQAEQQLANMHDEEIATLLRNTSAQQLLAIYPKWFGPTYHLPTAFRDGHVLPEDPPMTVLAKGNFTRVPIMIGSSRDEVKLFMMIEDQSLQRLFGIPVRLRDPVRYKLLSDYNSRRWKARGVDQIATAVNDAGHKQVYAYRTDWDDLRQILTLDFKVLAGALHGVEMPFLQGNLDQGIGNLIQPNALPEAQKLGAAMRAYWAQFAYAGDPGQGRDNQLPHWQRWQSDVENATFLVFDAPADGGIHHSTHIEATEAILADIAVDSRFESECDRCEALAGQIPSTFPNYQNLPQDCRQFISASGVLACPVEW